MTMQWPKITVVTPSYNQAEYLEETIESVLNQNYPNLEYILLDGGSTDGSIDIIKKYEKHFTYWRAEPDDGQAAAISEGFQRSTGDIMCWLNSDDLFAPGALAIVAEYLQKHPKAEFIVGEACIVNGNGEIEHYLSEPKWDTNWQLYVRNCIPQPSVFWRRSLYTKVDGVNSDYKFGMDYDLWFQFLQHTKPCFIKKLLSFQRLHPLAKTATLQHIAAVEKPNIARKYISKVAPYSKERNLSWRIHRVLVKLTSGSYFRGVIMQAWLKSRRANQESYGMQNKANTSQF